MVKFGLFIHAKLQNLDNLEPRGGVDDPKFAYLFKLKCGNCGEVTEKETCVSLHDKVRTPKWCIAHLYQKCKFCEREGTVTLIPGKGYPLTLQHSESESGALLMIFDCDGFEPLDFQFTGKWKFESKATMFEDIDLSGEEFFTYDEKAGCAVGIFDLHATFSVVTSNESSSSQDPASSTPNSEICDGCEDTISGHYEIMAHRISCPLKKKKSRKTMFEMTETHLRRPVIELKVEEDSAGNRKLPKSAEKKTKTTLNDKLKNKKVYKQYKKDLNAGLI